MNVASNGARIGAEGRAFAASPEAFVQGVHAGNWMEVWDGEKK